MATTQRSTVLSLRVNSEELNELRIRAEAESLSVSDFVRAQLGLPNSSTPTPHYHSLAARLETVERRLGIDTGDALNQARDALSAGKKTR